jgi:pimeloyl-ACP methyl ester carboxylesterase
MWLIPAVVMAMVTGLVTSDADATRPALNWQECGSLGAECSELSVPLDWSRPHGDRITVAVSRLRAADPARRIGVLFFNPGGPGNAARPYVRDLGEQVFAPELRDRFDIVGVDPRGVGDSRPAITCEKPTVDAAGTRYPDSRAQFDRLAVYNREVAEGCRRATGPLIDHVDTVSAARDFDAVRGALGEQQVSWLGLSYGTLLATTYAHLYPLRVRAAVLDGPVDHTIGSRRLAADEAASTEEVFGAFADWCQSDQACALHGRDVRAEYRALLDRAPLAAAGFPDGASVEEIGFGTYAKLMFRNEWPGLAKDIADAATNAAAFAAEAPTDPAYRVISCHDMPTGEVAYPEFADRLAEVRRLAPTTRGYVEGWDVQAGCLDWPVKPANPWGSVPVQGVPRTLVVAGALDPATPHAWGLLMAAQIRGSRLLTWNEPGHTAYLNDPETLRLIVDYLIG